MDEEERGERESWQAELVVERVVNEVVKEAAIEPGVQAAVKEAAMAGPGRSRHGLTPAPFNLKILSGIIEIQQGGLP